MIVPTEKNPNGFKILNSVFFADFQSYRHHVYSFLLALDLSQTLNSSQTVPENVFQWKQPFWELSNRVKIFTEVFCNPFSCT